MNRSERDYWILWNQLYQFIGPIKFDQLLRAFGSAEKAWEAPEEAFRELGWGSTALQALKSREKVVATTTIGVLSRYKIKVITKEEGEYPDNLRTCPTPPPLLYVRGELSPSDSLSLAVVGTRRMTRYGGDVVGSLIPELCAAGLTIVSGLALGVDAAAHKAALEAGGRTVAVLAGGVDQVTPRSNERLGQEIISRGGAIISEFPLGTQPFKSLFPFRNRIISGMSLGTLVIEAAEGSGTFHTVRAALEQGREVFAIPGSIFSPYSAGTAKLIQSGAKLVTSARDILEELEVGVRSVKQEAKGAAPATVGEKEVLELLEGEEKCVNDIIKDSDMPTNEVLSALTLLEMRGLVKDCGGGVYRRVACHENGTKE